MNTDVSENLSIEKTIKPKGAWEQAVGVMAALSMVLSIISLFISLKKTIPSFGVVDTQVLIHEVSKQLAKKYSSGTIDSKHLRQAVEQINVSVEAWTHTHHKTLLFAKGTLWGKSCDVQDVTDQILTDLEWNGNMKAMR